MSADDMQEKEAMIWITPTMIQRGAAALETFLENVEGGYGMSEYLAEKVLKAALQKRSG